MNLNDSDLVFLGRRIDNVNSFIKSKNPELSKRFMGAVNEYFIPLIMDDNLSTEEEDDLFEEMDNIIDYLEKEYKLTFESV